MTSLEVRGAATPEEIAAVTAVLASYASPEPVEDAYTRWRRTRLDALRVGSTDGVRDRRPG